MEYDTCTRRHPLDPIRGLGEVVLRYVRCPSSPCLISYCIFTLLFGSEGLTTAAERTTPTTALSFLASVLPQPNFRNHSDGEECAEASTQKRRRWWNAGRGDASSSSSMSLTASLVHAVLMFLTSSSPSFLTAGGYACPAHQHPAVLCRLGVPHAWHVSFPRHRHLDRSTPRPHKPWAPRRPPLPAGAVRRPVSSSSRDAVAA